MEFLTDGNCFQEATVFSPFAAAGVDWHNCIGDLEEEKKEVGFTKKRKLEKIDGGGLAVEEVRRNRRLWMKDRSNAWWESMNRPETSDIEFRQAFRMNRRTFNIICDELSPVISKEDTMLRRAIPVSKRVAICLWRLATGEPLRVVSQTFGVGISTCHKIILEVCSAVKTVLMPKFLKWPDQVQTEEIKNRFFELTSGEGIPDVIGTMHTTQISIVAPKKNVGDYFNKRHTEKNQRSSYSVAIQGIVNADGIFTDICIGLPGSMSDDQVLTKSTIYHRLNQIQRQNHNHDHENIFYDRQTIFHRQNQIQRQNYNHQNCNHRNQIQREVIVGGKEYPLLEWLMIPYAHQNLTWTQHMFNEKVREVRRFGVNAFGRLKGRWRCLQKRTEVKVEDLPVILGACCVLHNVCETMEMEMDVDLLLQIIDKNDNDSDNDQIAAATNWNGIQSIAAEQTRNEIAHNLLHGGNLSDSKRTKTNNQTIRESFWMDE